tara:strand:+ start:2222 stop:2641 length:420 start_codon:yes stop_codon:yes gene_type:complete
MNNQEILDNAPEWADTHRKLLSYPDCTTYANNAKDEQVLDRSLADISRIAELELMLIHRTKEVGNWILRYDKSVTKQREIIHGQKMRIVELGREKSETLEIIEAVAHVGVDFGYGKYELESDKIDKARAIFEELTEQGK